MTIAFDAVSPSGSQSAASFNWLHTPAGVPDAIVVYVTRDITNAGFVTGVTYGGIPMHEDPNSPKAFDGAGSNDSTMHCFYLDREDSIPAGAQTVEVTCSSGVANTFAAAISIVATLSALRHTSAGAADGSSGTSYSLSVTTTVETFLLGAICVGLATVGQVTPGAGMTEVYEVDTTNEIFSVLYRTTNPAAGSPSIDWTLDADQEHADIAIAFEEVASEDTTEETELWVEAPAIVSQSVLVAI